MTQSIYKSNPLPKISIALCTYNGEKYLKEQFESFLRQKLLPHEIVVCDDVSTDSTVKILEDFSRTAPFPVRIYQNDHNIGLTKNFSKAASLCTGEYVAFSDQDDIWLPDRLDACCHKMKEAELEYGTDIPLLVYSDLSIIDSEGHFVGPSFMRHQNMWHSDPDPLGRLLAQNTVSGSTALCNKTLMHDCMPFPEVITNHDGWFALVAASCGKILFIPETQVLYRKHDSNVVGASPRRGINLRFIARYIKREFFLTSNPIDIIFPPTKHYLHQAKELQTRLKERNRRSPAILNIFIDALEKGGVKSTLILLMNNIRPYGLIKSLIYYHRIARRLHLN
jgi:glycosyltransferase involved in cell wall biosynthesis